MRTSSMELDFQQPKIFFARDASRTEIILNDEHRDLFVRRNNNGTFCALFHIHKMVTFLAVKHEPAKFKHTRKFLVVYGSNVRHAVLYGY